MQINSETDQQFGIIVTPIAQTAKSAAGVMVPVTSLVEADGKQLVFVQYQNFYEPVEVKTGKTQGENIEVIDGLSVGEKLVTQGSLSLYAQSRKTQKADPASPSTVASPNAVATAIATPQSTAEHNQAHAKGIAHSDQGVLSQESNLLVGGVVVGGSALALIGGGIFLLKNRQSSRKKLKLNSRSKNQGDV